MAILPIFFFYLDSIQLAEERVRMRVSKGGHNVSKQSIIERFDGGLELLDQSLLQFETVIIYNTSQSFGSKGILSKGKYDSKATALGKVPRLLFERVTKLRELGISEDSVE